MARQVVSVDTMAEFTRRIDGLNGSWPAMPRVTLVRSSGAWECVIEAGGVCGDAAHEQPVTAMLAALDAAERTQARLGRLKGVTR
jgi:hypothetical protein